MKSADYVQRLIAGNRSFSEQIVKKWVAILGLQGQELHYFELIVRYQKEPPQSQLAFEYAQQIETLRTNAKQLTVLKEQQLQYITSWYHLVLREMALMQGATNNVQWFRKTVSPHIQLSGSQIVQYLNELQQAQLLVEKDHEFYAPNPIVSMQDETLKSPLTKYHREALENALAHLEEKSTHKREYGAVLVATTPERFKKAKEHLKKFRLELGEILDCEEKEATLLASFSFQLLNLAESS